MPPYIKKLGRPVTITHRRPLPSSLQLDVVTEQYIASKLDIPSGHSQGTCHLIVPKLLGPCLKLTQHNMSRETVPKMKMIPLAVCDPGWDLDPSFPTRDEATVKAVETTRFSAFQVMSAGKWPRVPPKIGHTNTRVYYTDLLRQLKAYSVWKSDQRDVLSSQ